MPCLPCPCRPQVRAAAGPPQLLHTCSMWVPADHGGICNGAADDGQATSSHLACQLVLLGTAKAAITWGKAAGHK